MPPLLIAVAPKKKPTSPLSRPGLSPPPFGGGAAGKSYASKDEEAPPDNKLAAAAALAGAVGAGEGDPYGDEPMGGGDPLGGAEKETLSGDGDNTHSGAMFSQEQAGYCDAQTRCKTCDYMVQPNACTYVQGMIDDDGCCPLHSSRGAASEALEPGAEGATDELG